MCVKYICCIRSLGVCANVTLIFCARQIKVAFFAVWKNYLNLGNGTSPHKSAEPIAIHFKLGPVKSSGKLLEQTNHNSQTLLTDTSRACQAYCVLVWNVSSNGACLIKFYSEYVQNCLVDYHFLFTQLVQSTGHPTHSEAMHSTCHANRVTVRVVRIELFYCSSTPLSILSSTRVLDWYWKWL